MRDFLAAIVLCLVVAVLSVAVAPYQTPPNRAQIFQCTHTQRETGECEPETARLNNPIIDEALLAEELAAMPRTRPAGWIETRIEEWRELRREGQRLSFWRGVMIVRAETTVATRFNDSEVSCAPGHLQKGRFEVAHPTLPCGTKVRVTNLNNGRTVMAYVADHGPCATAHCRRTRPDIARHRHLDLDLETDRYLRANGKANVRYAVDLDD